MMEVKENRGLWAMQRDGIPATAGTPTNNSCSPSYFKEVRQIDFTAIMEVINGTATPIAFAVIILVMWWKDRDRNYEREEEF